MGSSRAFSAPRLPSVGLRERAKSCLDSDAKASHLRCWERTLQERIGTPGPAPDLPGLQYGTSQRLGTSCSRISSSSVGPSASVMAWLVQFRCEKCFRTPTDADAKFCCSCGTELPRHPSRSVVSSQGPPRQLHAERSSSRRARSEVQAANVRRACREAHGHRPRPTSTALRERPPNSRTNSGGANAPLKWVTREHQLAQWMTAIRPRLTT